MEEHLCILNYMLMALDKNHQYLQCKICGHKKVRPLISNKNLKMKYPNWEDQNAKKDKE